MVKRSWGPRAHPLRNFVRSLGLMRLVDSRRGEPRHPYIVETERSGAPTQRVGGAQGNAILARSRSSSSSDLLSDKRYWERLVSSPPVVAAKRPGAVQDRGLNPRYRISEDPIGLRGRSVAFGPLLEMPAFLRAVKYCFCLRFSRRMVSCMKGSWDCNPALLVPGSLVQRFLAQNADSRTKAAM